MEQNYILLMLDSHCKGHASKGPLLAQEGAELGEMQAHSWTTSDSSGSPLWCQLSSAASQSCSMNRQRSQMALISPSPPLIHLEGKPVVLLPLSLSLPTGVSPTTIRIPLTSSCQVTPQTNTRWWQTEREGKGKMETKGSSKDSGIPAL